MTVTFTANYRETLTPETVTEIERLEGDNFELTAMLMFIDEYGEGNFKFYENYVASGEDFGFEVVDAFLTSKAGDFDDLWKLQDAYIGSFSSPEQMAEELLEADVDRLPYFVVIDWAETAAYLLDDEVTQNGSHYFRTHY